MLRSTKGKKVYFIRFVERWDERDRASGIIVLNRFIALSETYLNQYVFATLNLETATLRIHSEHDGISTEILHQPLPFTT